MAPTHWDKLVEIISTLLEIPPTLVSPDLGPDTLEAWDSLNHLSICTAVGQEFGVEMTTAEMLAVRKAGDFVAILKAKAIAEK